MGVEGRVVELRRRIEAVLARPTARVEAIERCDGRGPAAARPPRELLEGAEVARLARVAPTARAEVSSALADDADRALGPASEPWPAWLPRARALPGRSVETPEGPVHVVVERLAPEHAHGRVEVARMLAQPAALVAELALDPALADVDLSRALLLDIETTGLSLGTETLAFVVGLARFVDGALVVEQLVLLEPDRERAMLAAFAERVRAASCLVTYNGKAFDWPMLATRLALHGLDAPVRPHVDLLHVARRIYKRRLREMRLVHLERALLGLRRVGDVDGFEIPGLYWSFLRDGRAERLAPVLAHNASDVVALAALLAVFVERYASVFREDDPLDQLSRAQVALGAGALDRARVFAEVAAEGGGGAETTARALELAARVAEARGALPAALELVTQAITAAAHEPWLEAELHLRAARLAERGLGDLPRALEHARRTAAAEGLEASARRVTRLERRLARVGAAEARARAKRARAIDRAQQKEARVRAKEARRLERLAATQARAQAKLARARLSAERVREKSERARADLERATSRAAQLRAKAERAARGP
jgi:uncharacterized protein YprB with RNaseH-like and TPR domain